MEAIPEGSIKEIKQIVGGGRKECMSNLKALTERLQDAEDYSNKPEFCFLLEFVKDKHYVEIMHHLNLFFTRLVAKKSTKELEEKINLALKELDSFFYEHYGHIGRLK